MGGVSEIETHSNVPVSNQSIVKASLALCGADKATGPHSSRELETADFRLRWQANLGDLGAFEDITSNNVVENEVAFAVDALAIPLPVAVLKGNRDEDASKTKQFAPQSARLSELVFEGTRNTSHTLLPSHLAFNSDANRLSPKGGLHETS